MSTTKVIKSEGQSRRPVQLKTEVIASTPPLTPCTKDGYISEQLTIEANTTIAVHMQWFNPSSHYTILVSDDSMGIEHYLREVREVDATAKVLIRNSTPFKRYVTLFWQ